MFKRLSKNFKKVNGEIRFTYNIKTKKNEYTLSPEQRLTSEEVWQQAEELSDDVVKITETETTTTREPISTTNIVKRIAESLTVDELLDELSSRDITFAFVALDYNDKSWVVWSKHMNDADAEWFFNQASLYIKENK